MALPRSYAWLRGFLFHGKRILLPNQTTTAMQRTPLFYMDMSPEQRKAFKVREREWENYIRSWWLGANMAGSMNLYRYDDAEEPARLNLRRKIGGAC